MDRKIAMATIRGISVMESVEIAHQCEFTGVEIQTDYLPEQERECDAVFERIRQYGMEVNLHAPSGDINISAANRGIREESVVQVKQVIDLAKKYSVRNVTFHPGRLSSMREDREQKWRVLLGSVKNIIDYATQQEVYISIENMENRVKELVKDITDLNRFVQVSNGSPYFGVTLDVSHFATNGIASPDLRKLELPVRNVHISQCADKKPHLSLDIPKGEVQLEEVVKGLKKDNYQGLYVIEVKSIKEASILRKNKEELTRVLGAEIYPAIELTFSDT